jgi:formamidopyrimidine-DNA glycosylase
VPELPEVESARVVLERSALHRRIAGVDDSDTYVCRPHAPGELAAALADRSFTAVHRRGKQLWLETSGAGRSRTPGPVVGVHLGMSGRMLVTGRGGHGLDSGGDYAGSRVSERDADHKALWDRFTVTFRDGGTLRLFDPRRLGRVRLDPDLDALGPDAADLGVADLRPVLAASHVAVKARLLDQHAVAGIGNLLADDILWRARVHPGKPVDALSADEVAALLRATRYAIRTSVNGGGVHTLEIVHMRGPDARCPRDGTPMSHGTYGGRSTWFCPLDQRL